MKKLHIYFFTVAGICLTIVLFMRLSQMPQVFATETAAVDVITADNNISGIETYITETTGEEALATVESPGPLDTPAGMAKILFFASLPFLIGIAFGACAMLIKDLKKKHKKRKKQQQRNNSQA